MAGKMMASEIVTVLAAIGGTDIDLEKVLLLEGIYQEHREKE